MINENQYIKSYNELLSIIENKKIFLLYVSMKNCNVCHVDMPKVIEITQRKNLDIYSIETSEIPEAVGQLTLFAVPVVILFYEGKEIHRQAKMIDFLELEYRIEQVLEN